MAAYAALVSLMHIIHDIEHHHCPPISLDKPQVESLTQIVTLLQEFLEGYNSQISDDSDEADPLERRITDAAYAAQEVIESHIVDTIQLNRSKETKIGWANQDDEQIKCIKFYQDVQKVIEEMNLIKKVVMEMVVHDEPHRNASTSVGFSEASETGQSSTMVYYDDVLLEIMEKLVGGQLDRQIIPIVGMGGIGKTTLARYIFAQPLILEYFDICVWSTISQQYNSREILCELLSQATKRKKEELSERSEDKVGSELYKYLCGRRFLIVMDDMWSSEAWDNIKYFFPNNKNGSRILVTTRLSQLSSQLKNNYSHHMKFLDEVRSWDMFSKTVFGEKNCPHELKKIGKQIVGNCRGLPLSILVVGGLLKNMEHTKRSWESIRKNLTSVVNLDNDKHCFRLLKLSYNHLPVYLKPCFLYMGVFEEDDTIRVSTLLRLWVSEGFLKPMNGKSLEEIAKGFLKDLVDRNLLISKLGFTGNMKYCKIHDLLRDLCLSEGKKDGFYNVIGQCIPQGINNQRRIVIPKNTSQKKVLEALQSMSHARSIICEYGKVPPCQNLGLLSTLHAYRSHVYGGKNYVNTNVFQNLNLRYLAVEVRSMSSIFPLFNFLWNLHTLIVSCQHKSTAPVEIWKMPHLRHIEFVKRRCCLPDPPSTDVVIMENLHILKGVKNFKLNKDVVDRIPNIKKLGIKYCGRKGIDCDDYYCLTNIISLSKLEFLHISCDGDFSGTAFLQKLTFPHSLKKLTLRLKGHEFEWEDMLEKISSLPLLQNLKLIRGQFRTGEWEIVQGQFPYLKRLELYKCRGLESWTAQESSIFPHLVFVCLAALEELKEIPSQIGNIPTLELIYLYKCNKSLVKSAKGIVEEQVEMQGEQLPFCVNVLLSCKNQALQSLEGPNFNVSVSSRSTYYVGLARKVTRSLARNMLKRFRTQQKFGYGDS